MSCKFETRNVKKKTKKKKTMVKQNKQINDQNSYWLKAQRNKGEQRTSKQAKKKKKSLSDLKEKSAKSTSKFKAKYIKRILKK